MSSVLNPWQLYIGILVGWVNRQQQEAIDYLRTENQVLKEKLGKNRIWSDYTKLEFPIVVTAIIGR